MNVFDKEGLQQLCGDFFEEIRTGNIPEEYKNLTVRYIDIFCNYGYAKFGDFVFNRGRFIVISQDIKYKKLHNKYYSIDSVGYKIRSSPDYYFFEAMFAGIFTDQLDCNGKPIFTGDIVRANDYLISGVCAMSNYDRYALLFDNHCLFLENTDSIEVVGSVFFNVNLLDHYFDIRQYLNNVRLETKGFLNKASKAPCFKDESWQDTVSSLLCDEIRPFITCDRVASPHITELQENEVFVFGSNKEGNHIGGAARLAYDEFGAQWTKGVGHYGESYAIPTMDGSIDDIEPFVNDFLNYAKCYPEYRFLVTEIGCGIAGYKVEDIAPLFGRAIEIENICLPRSFWEELNVEVEQERVLINKLEMKKTILAH